ncbi:MAG: hypothetical protein EZS28_022992 [Streblomastix strix]|uniref:Uncharacterized protein n=1 Tax=Streblomastix strix TaxID=222440 RepID=A0A5J4VG54_9EUKA|nr:MAG: hypothetical protein EZS28_022992 [Streblomastix strix]
MVRDEDQDINEDANEDINDDIIEQINESILLDALDALGAVKSHSITTSFMRAKSMLFINVFDYLADRLAFFIEPILLDALDALGAAKSHSLPTSIICINYEEYQ